MTVITQTPRKLFDANGNTMVVTNKGECYRCRRPWADCVPTLDSDRIRAAMSGRALSYPNGGAYPLQAMYGSVGLDPVGIWKTVDVCNDCSVALMEELQECAKGDASVLLSSEHGSASTRISPMWLSFDAGSPFHSLIAALKINAVDRQENVDRSAYLVDRACGSQLLREHAGKGGEFIATMVEKNPAASCWSVSANDLILTAAPMLGMHILFRCPVHRDHIGNCATMPALALRLDGISQVPLATIQGEWTAIRGMIDDVVLAFQLVVGVLHGVYCPGRQIVPWSEKLLRELLAATYKDRPAAVAEAIRALKRLKGNRAKPLQTVLWGCRESRSLAKLVEGELRRDPEGPQLDGDGEKSAPKLDVQGMKEDGYSDAEIERVSQRLALAHEEGNLSRIPALVVENGKVRLVCTTYAEIVEELRPGTWLGPEVMDRMTPAPDGFILRE